MDAVLSQSNSTGQRKLERLRWCQMHSSLTVHGAARTTLTRGTSLYITTDIADSHPPSLSLSPLADPWLDARSVWLLARPELAADERLWSVQYSYQHIPILNMPAWTGEVLLEDQCELGKATSRLQSAGVLGSIDLL